VTGVPGRPRWGYVGTGIVLVMASIVLLVVVLLGDVSGESDDRTAEVQPAALHEPATSTTTTAPAPTTTARDPVLGNGQPVTFAFGGDVHFEKAIRTRLDADPSAVLAPVAPIFADADISMVNLETAITEGGTPVPKEFTFRAPATAFDALRLGNVDVATMANNHGIDYGPQGLADSVAAIASSGYPVVGIGADASQAYGPWRTEVNGQRIAVFGASEVIDEFLRSDWMATDDKAGIASAYPEGLDRLLQAIADERAVADTIVVYLHYGHEGDTCPNDRQEALSQKLLDAGADIVVGSHAHRLQGAGRKGDGFVAYGLGNFVFYNEKGAAGDSGVLTVTATGREIDSYAWTPARIQNGVPTPLTGAAAVAGVDSWNARRDCTDLAA
jgi:poly-gamma-glutamate capsule biosynthesis protein CapA/YwtB (metallophosphatase superfamily)